MSGLDFRQVFDLVPSPYMIASADLTIVAVNDAYLAATMTRQDEIIGRHLFEAFPVNPDDPAAEGQRKLRASFDRVLETGARDTMALVKYDIPSRTGRDGTFEERYWSSINTPILAADGTVAYVIFRVEDVTEFVRFRESDPGAADMAAELQRHLEDVEADLFARGRELEDANDQLRRANQQLAYQGEELRAEQRAKDEFIATLSHELRNPLAAMQGALENLADELAQHGEDPAEHVTLGVLQRQSEKLTRMVVDLLDTSRAITGKLRLDVDVLDLREIVEANAAELRAAVRDGRRSMTMVLPDEAVWVRGDGVRLSQAIGNLLDNAVKFTRPGGRIWLTVTTGDDRATLEVRDDGIGFDPAIAPQLFQAFAQVDRSLDRSNGGLGLGLAIVHRLAGLHGGSVVAHSSGPGRGASFTMTLPTVGPPADEPSGEPPPSCDVLKILLVEDNADIAATYVRLLRRLGHDVAVEPSGRGALAAVASEPPDIVICDIGLPDLDGYELARRVRRDPHMFGATLIAMSGYGQPADVERSLDAGFDQHLVKPVRRAALTEALARRRPQ